MKRIISVLLVVIMVLASVSVALCASAIEGTCGKGLTWTLDDNGVLIIRGEGAINSYSSSSKKDFREFSERIKSVVIENGVTKIGNYAFRDFSNIGKVSISGSVKTIGWYAFAGCTALTELTLSNGIATIDIHAFEGCTALKAVTIPASVKEIDSYAFSKCSSLTDLALNDGLSTIGLHAFEGCTALMTVEIPASVKEIKSNAFAKCSSLSALTLNEGLTSIGSYAFKECSNLKSVRLPSSVKTIGSSAFAKCTSLKEIYIPNKDCKINSSAIPKTTTIYGNAGSTAQEYAKKNGQTFLGIDGNPVSSDPVKPTEPEKPIQVETPTRPVATSSSGGSSMSKAAAVMFDTSYSDTITETNKEDYFKAELTESGRVKISFTSYMQYYNIVIFDADGKDVWSSGVQEWISTTEKRSDTYYVDLEKGTYYMKIVGDFHDGWGHYRSSTGSYSFILTFKPSEANISEPNNKIAESKTIMFGSTCKGQIALNDREDYYAISLGSSGRITLKFTSYMQYYNIEFYDSDGKDLWTSEVQEWISTTEKRSDIYNVDLEKGTYYIKIVGDFHDGWGHYRSSTGNYSFIMTFKSSEANCSEPNNNIAESKAIHFGSTYRGQIALNDREDYYAIGLASSGNITIKIHSFMQYYNIVLYDVDGKDIWSSGVQEWVSSTQERSDTYNVSLEKGTYYIKIVGDFHNGWGHYYSSTGNYSFNINQNIPVSKPTSIKPSSIKTNSIKLSWSAVSGAKGYVVYRYDAAKNSYTKLGTTAKTAYTVKKLKAGTSYRFAVKAYKSAGGTNYYSGYSKVLTTVTKPVAPTIKVSAGTKQATIKWKAVSGAKGYIIYRATDYDGSFIKIGTTTETSFKAKKLTSGQTYYFKVVAYAKAGKTTAKSAASKPVGARIK